MGVALGFIPSVVLVFEGLAPKEKLFLRERRHRPRKIRKKLTLSVKHPAKT
jgi:hypothetical protein